MSGRITRAYPPIGRFEEVEGARVHFVDVPGQRPDAPTLVVLHGASANLREVHAALRPLLAGRHRLIFVDRPGHGYSARGGPDMGAPDAQAKRVAALLDRLGVDEAIVVGFSWGGAASLAFALDHPERAQGLLLIAPVSHPWPGRALWYYHLGARPIIGPLFTATLVMPLGLRRLRWAIHSVFAPNRVPPGYARTVGAPMTLRPTAFRAVCKDVARLKHHMARLSRRYGELELPIEAVAGTADTVLSPQIHAMRLAAEVEHANLVLLPDVGHMPHWVAQETVLAALERLIARIRDAAEIAETSRSFKETSRPSGDARPASGKAEIPS